MTEIFEGMVPFRAMLFETDIAAVATFLGHELTDTGQIVFKPEGSEGAAITQVTFVGDDNGVELEIVTETQCFVLRQDEYLVEVGGDWMSVDRDIFEENWHKPAIDDLLERKADEERRDLE